MEEFNGETFYTVEECAEYLGKTVDEVRELIRSGEMHAYKLRAIRCPWMVQKTQQEYQKWAEKGIISEEILNEY